VITPPTKLPTFFFGIRISKVRIDPQHDLHLILCHYHPLSPRTAQVPLPGSVGFPQALVDCGGTVLQTSNHQRPCRGRGRLLRAMWAWLLQPGETLAQAEKPGRPRVLLQEAIRIPVEQPCPALAAYSTGVCHPIHGTAATQST
jgi:hypothetical protein